MTTAKTKKMHMGTSNIVRSFQDGTPVGVYFCSSEDVKSGTGGSDGSLGGEVGGGEVRSKGGVSGKGGAGSPHPGMPAQSSQSLGGRGLGLGAMKGGEGAGGCKRGDGDGSTGAGDAGQYGSNGRGEDGSGDGGDVEICGHGGISGRLFGPAAGG